MREDVRRGFHDWVHHGAGLRRGQIHAHCTELLAFKVALQFPLRFGQHVVVDSHQHYVHALLRQAPGDGQPNAA